MSTGRKFEITDARSGAAFTVRVVTRASSTELVGVHNDGALKVRLVATPAGGDAANDELVQFLARCLNVPSSNIEIVAGHSGREKLVTVEGISTATAEERLAANRI